MTILSDSKMDRFFIVDINPQESPSRVQNIVLKDMNLPWYKSKRNIVPLLSFFAVFVMYIVRFSFSQASIPMSYAYNWSQFNLSLIVSSFYIGFLPSQLIGASASKAWGGKPVVATGLLLSCLGSIGVPILANFYFVVLVLRVIMGIGQGVMYPAMTELLSQWVIPSEKAFWLNFSWSGGQAGTIFCLGIYPILNKLFGWRMPFFAFGAIGLLWFYLWITNVWETPQLHPHLSDKEKLILDTYPPRGNKIESEEESNIIPWISIFSSWQLYPLMLIYFGYNWPFYLMINSLPTYLETVLGFNSSRQGFLSMLPYLFLWFTLLISGLISDWLIRKWNVPIWLQRKGTVFLGMIPSALVLIFLSSFSSSIWLTLVAINFAIAMPGFSMSGFSPAPFDLSPEYAGAITSACSLIGSVAGILCPIVTGLILDEAGCNSGILNSGDQLATERCSQAWFLSFRIGGFIYVFIVLIWIFFSSFKPISFTIPMPVSGRSKNQTTRLD